MKKNPFQGTIVAVPLPQAKPHWRLAKLDDPCVFLDMTKEQARYAAEAINKHEELVGLLRENQWLQIEGHPEPYCIHCSLPKSKCAPQFCALAALLKEEEVKP